MPSLAELQNTMSEAVLRGDGAELQAFIASAPITFARAIGVHRRTVLGGMANALRLSFPTVHWLVGERFFDQAARDYSTASPPRDALFEHFVAAFPDFIAAYPLADSLPYIADVARFDRAIEAAGQSSLVWREAHDRLAEGVTLRLAQSLQIVESAFALGEIRAAFESGDADGLAAINMDAKPGCFAIWRGRYGVISRALASSAGRFVEQLLAGADAAASLAAAIDGASPETALSEIQRDVFGAAFAHISLKSNEGANDA